MAFAMIRQYLIDNGKVEKETFFRQTSLMCKHIRADLSPDPQARPRTRNHRYRHSL